MITGLAVQRTLPYFTWSITEELNRLGFGAEPEPIDSPDATNVLKAIKAAGHPGLYVLCDFHPYLKDEPINIRLLHEIAMQQNLLGHTIILLRHTINLPTEVKRYSARFKLSMPTEEQLMNLVREEASNRSKSKGGRPVRSATDTFKKLVQNLKGISTQDPRQLVRSVILANGVMDENDIPEVNKAKLALMDMEGVPSFQYDTSNFSEVGGLVKLKAWPGKCAQDPAHFDLKLLGEVSDGFSGAEIEQVIVSALYGVAAIEAELTMALLEPAIHETNPLSVVMEEKIRQLRQWATDRRVFANE